MKEVSLIDGNQIGWRGFGTAPLSYGGKRTEMAFVGMNVLRNYIMQFEPDRCIVVWDGGRDERRLRVYPDYKRHRRKLTEVEKRERDIFFAQMHDLIDVFRDCGILQYHLLHPPREADDVIYNLVVKDGAEFEFTVVSTDKDFYQLLEYDNVKLYSPIRKKMIDGRMVEEELGIPVEWFTTYRAMVGDPSDNLPGVRGIGPAKAKKLIMKGKGGKVPALDDDMKKILEIFETDQFALMFDLIEFKTISDDEIKRGQLQPSVSSLSKLQESIMRICIQYGFERYLERFSTFIEPFEELWRRGRDESTL